jgi:L-fuconolactonase
MKQIAELGLAFDFLVHERHLLYVRQALELVPELRSVIDHAAKPNLRAGDLVSWKRRLAEVAAHPGVFCKLSGLVTEADPMRCAAIDLAPAIEPAFELFGENRVVFGSDWPVCTLAATYDEVIGRVDEVLGGRLGASAYSKLFGDNAQRLYRIA